MFYPISELQVKPNICRNLLLGGFYTIDSVSIALINNGSLSIPCVGEISEEAIRKALHKWKQEKGKSPLSWQDVVEIYMIYEGLPLEFRDELISNNIFSISAFKDFLKGQSGRKSKYYTEKINLFIHNHVEEKMMWKSYIKFAEKLIHMFYKHMISNEEFSSLFRYLGLALINKDIFTTSDFYGNMYLRLLAKRYVVAEINKKGFIYENKTFLPQIIFDELKSEVIKDGKELIYEDGKYWFNLVRINQWLETFSGRERDILLARVSGRTLASVANDYGVSRERIRQICDGVLSKRPTFLEDAFLPLFTKFAWDKDVFCYVTQEPDSTYNFLSTIAFRGKRKMIDMIMDDTIPQETKDRYMSYMGKELDSAKTCIIGNKITSVFNAFALGMGNESISIKQFIKNYKAFIKSKGLKDKYIDLKSVTARLLRLGEFIFGVKNTFRRYPVMQIDANKLKETLALTTFNNETFSSKVLFDAHPVYMEQIGIRHYYELHNLIKQREKELDIPTLAVGRRPILCFGNCSVKGQAIAILKEHQQLRLKDLAKLVHERYGINMNSFAANSISFLRQYRVEGDLYQYSESSLSDEEIDTLKDTLTEDVYSYKDAVALLEKKMLPKKIDKVNAGIFWRLGYYYRRGIVFSRKFRSMESALDSYFSGNTVHYFDPRNMSVAVRVYFQKKRHELALFHYDKDKVVNRAWVESYGFTEEGIREFIQAVNQYAGDKPFTIFSLKNSGFQHKYLNNEKDYYLLSSFLKGSEMFNYYSRQNIVIFDKSHRNPGVKLFIERLLNCNKNISTSEMKEILKRQYNVSVSITNIALIYRQLGVNRKGN